MEFHLQVIFMVLVFSVQLLCTMYHKLNPDKLLMGAHKENYDIILSRAWLLCQALLVLESFVKGCTSGTAPVTLVY